MQPETLQGSGAPPSSISPHPRGSDDWDSRLKLPGRDFPGDPVAKNPPSNAEGVGSIPGSGTKIRHATRTQKEAN